MVKQLFVRADVGGTFTDCLSSWQDDDGNQHHGCIKVLSTGLLRCRAGTVLDRSSLTLEIPQELLSCLPHRILPDNFFRSAILTRLVDGIAEPLGRIDAFDSTNNRLVITPDPRSTELAVDSGDLIQIDCQLEAPVLATRLSIGFPIDRPLPPLEVRLGTTRGTNALLTRSGAMTALVINQGFGDTLLIGEQDRAELFDLSYTKPEPIAQNIVEIRGRMDAQGNELAALAEDEIAQGLDRMRRSGVETLAICLLHAHLNPAHEITVQRIARSVGFKDISRSSEVAPLIKLISRAENHSSGRLFESHSRQLRPPRPKTVWR